MNGKIITTITLTLLMLGFSITAGSQDNLATLRGGAAIEGNSADPGFSRWEPDSEPIARTYIQQPPLIPHDVSGYAINLKFNKCLSCHSWTNYEQAQATKISQEHFKDRDGNAQSNVSANRYFCTQCHVAQRNVKPLVKNEFKGVELLQSK